jgi:hypothetical protein
MIGLSLLAFGLLLLGYVVGRAHEIWIEREQAE